MEGSSELDDSKALLENKIEKLTEALAESRTAQEEYRRLYVDANQIIAAFACVVNANTYEQFQSSLSNFVSVHNGTRVVGNVMLGDYLRNKLT